MKAAEGARENAISTIQAKAKAVLDKVEHVEKTLASVADERRKSIDAKLQKAELGTFCNNRESSIKLKV